MPPRSATRFPVVAGPSAPVARGGTAVPPVRPLLPVPSARRVGGHGGSVGAALPAPARGTGVLGRGCGLRRPRRRRHRRAGRAAGRADRCGGLRGGTPGGRGRGRRPRTAPAPGGAVRGDARDPLARRRDAVRGDTRPPRVPRRVPMPVGPGCRPRSARATGGAGEATGSGRSSRRDARCADEASGRVRHERLLLDGFHGPIARHPLSGAYRFGLPLVPEPNPGKSGDLSAGRRSRAERRRPEAGRPGHATAPLREGEPERGGREAVGARRGGWPRAAGGERWSWAGGAVARLPALRAVMPTCPPRHPPAARPVGVARFPHAEGVWLSRPERRPPQPDAAGSTPVAPAHTCRGARARQRPPMPPGKGQDAR